MRKLYRRPKIRSGLSGTGWSKRQSIIALISLVTAAVGSTASAVSTYLAWRQTAMLSKERLTPYRAVLYESKLESYKEIVGTVQPFLALLGQEHPSLPTGNMDSYSSGRAELTVADLPELRKSYDALEQSLAKNGVIWGSTVGVDIDKLRYSAPYIVQAIEKRLKNGTAQPANAEDAAAELDFQSNFNDLITHMATEIFGTRWELLAQSNFYD